MGPRETTLDGENRPKTAGTRRETDWNGERREPTFVGSTFAVTDSLVGCEPTLINLRQTLLIVVTLETVYAGVWPPL